MAFDWDKLQKDNKQGALHMSLESVTECFRAEMLLLRVVFLQHGLLLPWDTEVSLIIEYLHAPMMRVLITLVMVVGLKATLWRPVGMPGHENKCVLGES